MVSGKTSTGFEYEIDERAANDWRFVKALADADSDDESRRISGTASLVPLLLSETGEKALMRHIAEQEDGFVPTTRVLSEITEMLTKIRTEIKN